MDSHNRLSRDFVNPQKMRGSYVWVCGTVTGKLWVKMWVNVASRNEARLSTPLPRTPIRFGKSPVCACTTIGDFPRTVHIIPIPSQIFPLPVHINPTSVHIIPTPLHINPMSVHIIPMPVHIIYMPLHKLFLCSCTIFICPCTLFLCPCTLFLCQFTLLPRLCPTAQGLVSDTQRLSSPTAPSPCASH